MKNKSLYNDGGQTVVEYILLMFVLVIVIIAGMKQVEDWFLANSTNCQPNSRSMICKMDKTFNQTFNSYDSMRFFVLRR